MDSVNCLENIAIILLKKFQVNLEIIYEEMYSVILEVEGYLKYLHAYLKGDLETFHKLCEETEMLELSDIIAMNKPLDTSIRKVIFDWESQPSISYFLAIFTR